MTTGEHAIAGRLTDGRHELVQRVYFEDTDFSGRVYHARYLHFMERGRSDFLRLIGIHHHELTAGGLAFAVHRMEIEFRAAAGIDDLLTITTAPERIGGARLELAQAVRSGDRLLVKAAVSVALIGPDDRPRRLPVELRQALARIPE